jgi:adenosylcobinamide-phosphate synthase
MSFFAILVALLIEQVRPLAQDNPVHATMRNWVRWVRSNFEAGRTPHGWLVWSLSIGVPAAVTLGIHWLLVLTLGWGVAIVWSVAILYVTLGFRQFSHHFTGIRDALDAGDEELARQLLARWQRVDAADLPRSEIVRHVIEYSVLAAHRHVFGVLFWFTVLAALGLGPTGAVVYRMSGFLARYCVQRRKAVTTRQPPSDSLVRASLRMWSYIDWLPARITALGFAVVGSFEDAIDGWRHHAQRFPNDNDGVILAATAGAVNVRLGGRELRPVYAPESSQGFQAAAPGVTTGGAGNTSTPGREPEPAHLAQVVGLVWRSVVMWMMLLALLTLARLLG